ncbi:MAG: Phospholipase C [Alyxoria varia]|nr:MAG: Phospholipase C [Alyxoria varia]
MSPQQTASTPASAISANWPCSVPATPDTPGDMQQPEEENVAPLDSRKLPASSNPVSPGITSYGSAEASRPAGKGPGLIRRISRGAHNRLRPRTSTQNLKNRDQASGPTVVRARSSSHTLQDGPLDVSDLDLDDEDDPLEPLIDFNADRQRTLRTGPRQHSTKYLRNQGQMVIPNMLYQGTSITKVTKKKGKQKPFRIWLDKSHSKLIRCQEGSHSYKHLYVDDIKEIRVGDLARPHLEEWKVDPELLSRWFTVIYTDSDRSKGRTTKALHLIAPDVDVWRTWREVLQHLIKNRGELMATIASSNVNEKALAQYWNQIMLKKLGPPQHSSQVEHLEFADIVAFCRSCSIYKSEKDLRALFDKIDTGRIGSLDFSQFLEYAKQVLQRKDIKRVYEEFKQSPLPTMTLNEFFNFLRTVQGVDPEADFLRCRDLYDKYTGGRGSISSSPTSGAATPIDQGMTFFDFQAFLLNDVDNPPLASATPTGPFDRPLNEYFISSSHNTYLMGRQVAGESSSEGYVDALKKGCRCVEVDCWDGSDGNPKVTHGRTLSKWTSFADCIKAINNFAFFASPYPLIISLEVHCNPAQQKIMADIMRNTFASKLLLQALYPETLSLPSPEELKGKILIKVKEPMADPTIHANLEAAALHKRQRSKSEADMKAENPFASPRPPRARTFANSNTNNRRPKQKEAKESKEVKSAPASNSDDSVSDVGVGVGNAESTKAKAKTNIVPALGDLGVYTRGIKFTDFRAQKAKTYNHIFSFKESTFEDKCRNSDMKRQLEEHNQKYLMRVYPKGIRYSSSNPDPLLFWRRGVQMVATNWQTYDLGTQINDAMFAAGPDRNGYVLKPEELRRSSRESRSERGSGVKRVVKFGVSVISARHLDAPRDLKSEMNPYVEIEMYSADNRAKGIATADGGTDASAPGGVSGIGLPTRRRTPVVQGNGYDPFFDSTIQLRLETQYSSLVFVRWTVWHAPDGKASSNKEPLASFTAKLSDLQQGYRRLKLYNNQGEQLVSELFCRINREDLYEAGPTREHSPESPRGSDENPRPSRQFFRRVFSRTPSEKPKSRKNSDGVPLSRTTSTEK